MTGSRTVLVAAAISLGAYLGYSIVNGTIAEQTAIADARTAAAPIAQLCDTGRRAVIESVGGSCEQAYQVVAGARGATGAAGIDGRGVRSTAIVDGRLVITYTDGARDDLGVVVGAAGGVGDPGEPGRGITGTVIVEGRLVVAYSDGASVDVGPVVGEDGDDGRGVRSIAIADGRLLVTYDDGSTEDAGAVPAGPAGPPGPTCPPEFESVETGPVTGSDGRSYLRSITCVDPSSVASPEPTAPATTGATPTPALPGGDG